MAAGPLTLSAAGLRLRFARSGDRYVHQVMWLDAAGNENLLLATIEGDDTNPWPPSPPLQDLHLESRGAGATVALAVGMAGRSHWSLSVEALAEGELRFDVACRANDPPGTLGSSYRLGEGVAAESTAAGITLSVQGQAVAIITADAAQASLQVPAASSTADAENVLAIVPLDVPAVAPTTVRWQYGIQAGR